MDGSRRHAAGIGSALAISAVIALVFASSVIAKGPAVLHRISAGGPDACSAVGAHPGCDGDYAFVATQYADGTVSGRYTDVFARGAGIMGAVDCVVVIGNQAWVSGRITSGRLGDLDLRGEPFTTLVVDNGDSANDPPDQISSSHTFDPTPCTDRASWDLFDVPQGQVTID